MLKVKSKSTNDEWLEAVSNIEKYVSGERVKTLAEQAREHVKKIIKGKNPVIAYSAGKDSIVLEHVLRGLNLPCIMATSELEYPSFMDWVQINLPNNTEIINSGIGYDFLRKNQHMIFPDNSKLNARWFSVIQHKVQNNILKKRFNAMIYGRRIADGNQCGKDGSYYTGDALKSCPIYKWTHEEILAYLHYNKIELPPIYQYEDGYRQGTHAWPAFIRKNGVAMDDCYVRLYGIGKSIVEKASDEGITTAKQFLERI